MGARSRARERTPIYNKMKAIRGDNPRTTNQRVYLMPVVPSPPPEKPPTPDVEQFSLSFPLAFYPPTRLSSIYLSICSSPSPITLHLSLSFTLLVAPRLSLFLSLSSTLHPLLPSYLRSRSPASSRCCSRICHYATDIANPRSSLFALLLAHSLTLGHPLRRTSPPRYLQRVVRSHIPAI